jgi:hypothetical protein
MFFKLVYNKRAAKAKRERKRKKEIKGIVPRLLLSFNRSINPTT